MKHAATILAGFVLYALIGLAAWRYEKRAAQRRADAAEQRRQDALAYGRMIHARLINECVARECTDAELAHIEAVANREVSA